MAEGDAHLLLAGKSDNGTDMFRVWLRRSGGVYQVRANLADDGTAYPSTGNYTVTDGLHFIETDWAAASAPGANDGYMTLWIDGVLQNTVAGVDNDTRRVEKVYFGPSSGLDAGTSGTEYADAFESRRSTYIGPAGSGSLVTATINYTYDPLYRLTNANYSGAYTYTFAYVYDPVGNRTAQTRTITSTQVITYVYDNANRMTKASGVTYTWDNNGNLINDGSALYRYDQANRLISTTLSGATSLFNYNGDGVRLKQIVAGTPTTYTQDLAAPLPVVLQAKTVLTTTKYLYNLGTRPLAQYGAAWEYLLPDALGSVRQIADASGNVTLAESYEPYGTVLTSTGTASSIFGFSGEQIDTSGLTYLRARYMNPQLGIFLARDPWSGDVLRPGSMNGFNYVEGNPISFVDSSGLARGPIETLIYNKYQITWGLGHRIDSEFYVRGGSKQGLTVHTAGQLGQPGFVARLGGQPNGNPGWIDMVDRVTYEAYEIKNEREAINAIAEINWYIATYNSNPDARAPYLRVGRTYTRYPDWELVGTNPVYGGQDLYATLRADGALTWRGWDKRQPFPWPVYVWVLDQASQTYKRQQRQLVPAYADNAALQRAGEAAAITTFLYGCFRLVQWGFQGLQCVNTGACQFSP